MGEIKGLQMKEGMGAKMQKVKMATIDTASKVVGKTWGQADEQFCKNVYMYRSIDLFVKMYLYLLYMYRSGKIKIMYNKR
jgi:hypothetical protein